MAKTVTLTNLILQVRERSDHVNSNFVSDAELTRFINKSAEWFYDLLTDAGVDYFTTTDTVATDGSTEAYNLPADFYKLRGVDYTLNGEATAMDKFVFLDRNRYVDRAPVTRYRIVGDQIHFKPAPSAQTITLWYDPVFTDLSAGGDTLDTVNGWDEFVILDSAIKVLDKEESDSTLLRAERDQHLQRIEDMKRDRDLGLPETVTDVTRVHLPRYHYFRDY